MWKIAPNDKHTQNKYDHIQIISRTCLWNYSMELGERRKRKENNRASVIL
jgi:hypothetical protein